MLRGLIFLMLFVNVQVFAKIRILTFHYNQADFIEMQHKTLNKFLRDDFELIVFNDAKTEENKDWIESVCKQYQIKCVRYEPEWHVTNPLNSYLKMRLQEPSTKGAWGWNGETTIEEIRNNPSVRHSHVIQYALDHYGYDHDDIVVILDGDNFLIQPLSIRELLGSNDIVGFNQWPDNLAEQRLRGELSVPKNMEMFWVVFIAFNPRKLPNIRELQLNVDVISGHPHLPQDGISDTGAALFKYLWKHPELKLQAYPWQSSYTYYCLGTEKLKTLGLNNDLIQFIYAVQPNNVQLFVFEHFMHFSSVSWEGDDHPRKVRHFRNFINTILSDKE
jgi:glycosyltransferase involved in cell wall biosynthesis